MLTENDRIRTNAEHQYSEIAKEANALTAQFRSKRLKVAAQLKQAQDQLREAESQLNVKKSIPLVEADSGFLPPVAYTPFNVSGPVK